jgi:hypothetical protein
MVAKFTTSRGKHYLGMRTYRPGAIRFKLEDYVDVAKIETPKVFGHIDNSVDYLMLGNDQCGDCVVAGECHETMIWTRAVTGRAAPFTAQIALEEYKAASGWNGLPDDPSDSGLDMAAQAKRRRDIGILDAQGIRHKINAYARINTIDDLIKAMYVFGAVGIGVQIPQSAVTLFDQQQPWTVVTSDGGDRILGGHYMTACGLNSHGFICVVTWGRLQAIAPAWIDEYCDVIIGYISPDYIDPRKNLTPELIDSAKLAADLAALGTVAT